MVHELEASGSFSEPCILGIDEAGRGPVLGPMVYGCAFCEKKNAGKLKDLGVADSKVLTEEKRDNINDAIREHHLDWLGFCLIPISPEEVSQKMLRLQKTSLNVISHNAAAQLIQFALDGGANIKEVFVDTVGDPGKYQTWLSSQFPGISITVTAKADALYPIVSAASVVAKVCRDRTLASWKWENSGYVSCM
jgi:ribonuclease H2 subunit A